MVKLSAKFKPNSRKERLLIMNNRSFGAFGCTNILLFSFIVIMASIGLTANVQAACSAGSMPVTQAFLDNFIDPAAGLWEVEGPVSEFNTANLTMTVIGFTFQVPSLNFQIDTAKLIPANNPVFSDMDDDLSPTGGLSNLLGGTVIALGRTELVPGTVVGETCAVFIAEDIFYEKAENVLAGLLSVVTPGDSTFEVNGTLTRMNPDPRLPSDILNLGGEKITIQDLVGFEGTLVSFGGYYDPVAGILFGALVETEVAPQPAPGAGDSLVISRVRSRRDRGELRIEGQVITAPGTSIALTIDIFHGVTVGLVTGCTGVLLQSGVPVDPIDGFWGFRRRGIPEASFPDNVCAVSPNGGIDDREVP